MQDNISITEKKTINENLYTICDTLDYVIIFRINILTRNYPQSCYNGKFNWCGQHNQS